MLLNKLISIIIVLFIHIGLASKALGAGLTGSSQNTTTQSAGNTSDDDCVTINNNLFWQNTNNFSGVAYDTVTNPGNCLFEDPMLGADFLPRWDEGVISPCIDAGFGDADVDGTPPDIGAVKAVNHGYWEYSFTTQADLEKWYWVSYPVLNSVTVNEDYNALEASVFFKELLTTHEDSSGNTVPTHLERIDWKEVGAENSIYWSEQLNNWTSNMNAHIVSSPQGYKIKLLQRSPAVVTLKETGMRTPVNTQFAIYGQNNGQTVENWLGYFKAEPAWPHEVFASIWDDINMIKTKNWCLVRANPWGDYWGMHGKVTPLKDGDMVIVTTNNTHNTFQWSTATVTPPLDKAPPEHFVFSEKPDYVPIYITMPDSLITNLKEVGLYLDGVCKGAVVVEKNLEQICAYLDLDDDLAHGLIEFIFYYNDDKSQLEERKTILMNNSRFQARYANGNAGYPFYDISISNEDMENVAPLPLNLGQNYPNPFNPSTTISYQLPQSGKVRLDIFNLRGQLVRTLLNSEMEAGEHRVVWNGADANGLSVGSGLYFYRLSSPAGTLSRRMLLMK